MTVITREFINKNIKFYDLVKSREDDDRGPMKIKTYDYNELSKEIDLFKNILQSHFNNDCNNRSIIIGIHPSIQQTACIFACFELGISICIIDYTRADNFKQYSYVDPKTELLLPIDLFIVLDHKEDAKYRYFTSVCNSTIALLELENLDYSENKNIFSNEDSVIMRCTSSGTTDTPKVIEHTHKFIYNLSKRNTTFYHGSVGITHNLNHGSSFATYFLPAICCDRVKEIYNATQDFQSRQTFDFLKNVDHVMIPYSFQVHDFCRSKPRSETIVYTLSIILDDFFIYYKKKVIKDIVSFFGSNETSGPTLINRISKKNFKPGIYFKFDDFYNIFLEGEELNVDLPFYENKVINTKDRFETTDQIHYNFLGRNDLKKINGFPVNEQNYFEVVHYAGLKKFHLVYDIFENKIYLAFEDSVDNIEKIIKRIRKQIMNFSDRRHTIDKFAKIDFSEFMTGVKLDQELLRYYFRNYVS